ncbi:MAG TPA: DUF2809 domain-containing protein [Bryobacteraceae bacterium]|jgi:hypothetical protein
MIRRRLLWACSAAALIPIGLWLRFAAPVPEWLRDGSGGALYVVFWIFAILVLKPETPALPLTVSVLLATCAIEFSQQWHPAWLERLRATLPGRLVLGTTFDWGDFPPYFVGAMIGWLAVRSLRKTQKSRLPQ